MSQPLTPTPSPSPRRPSPVDATASPRLRQASPPRGGRWRRPRAVLAFLFAVVSLVLSFLPLFGGLGPLGGLFGPGAVPSSRVASDVQRSVPGGLATCWDDLPARVGATTSCAVLDGADTVRVRATVTAVNGDDVSYDLETVG